MRYWINDNPTDNRYLYVHAFAEGLSYYKTFFYRNNFPLKIDRQLLYLGCYTKMSKDILE